jgi:AAA15 family ATPase/GTPase
MNIKKISLTNFRKFKSVDLDFKKINILVGPNNSGKSAVIKAMLLLHDNIENEWKGLRFGNETSHRILSFDHSLNNSSKREFSISFELELFHDVSELSGSIEVTFREAADKSIVPDIQLKGSEGVRNRLKDQFSSFLDYAPPNRSIGLKEYDKKRFRRFAKILSKAKLSIDFENEGDSTFINKWCREFGIADKISIQGGPTYEKNYNSDEGLYLIDNATPFTITLTLDKQIIDLSYLGTGSSQLLFMILQVAVASQQLIILEEPETNLHPSYQSKLADMILNGFAEPFGNQFIIETHSEYLIRRFQYLVAKGKAKSEDIQIYYFSGVENEPPRILTIEKDGALSGDFGKGFFDEAPYLITELWKAQRN